MLSPSDFHEIVSGRRRGPLAAALRTGLRIVEVPYTAAVRFRNLRFDRGHAEIHHLETPVLSIGNLTMGGTGKTPMVAWLVEWCQANRLDPALLSRGYGGAKGKQNDEAAELAQRFPNVPHVQNPDRVAGARQLISNHAPDLIILDDGFQHRRLHRDLDIVLIDALQPFGFGHVFPRGSLREPITGLARADIAILTRADAVSEARRQELRKHFQSTATNLHWFEATSQPIRLVSTTGSEETLDGLDSKKVLAFCAIGNPAGFRHTLASIGCSPRQLIEFPDHHRFRRSDLDRILAALEQTEDSLAVCTCKDLTKLPPDHPVTTRTLAVEVRQQIEPQDEFGRQIRAALRLKECPS